MKFLNWNKQTLIVLLFSILALTACNDQETKMETPPPEVVAMPAFKESIKESASVVGQIVAKESVDLKARVKGFLEKRLFAEGSFIRKDQLLFQIEKTEYEAQVEAAEAKLDTAKANLKNDTIDYNRQKYLANKDATSQKIFEKAECQRAISEAGVLSAQAELKEANLNLTYTDIKAPFNGRIGLAKYSVGNVVGPDSDPLAHVVMINPIQVEFNLSESLITTILQEVYKGKKKPDPKSKKAPKIKEVIPKLILSNGTEYPLDGEIDFVNNVVNPMTGTVKLRAKFDNPKALLAPGAYVVVKLENRHKTPGLLIPQAAIQEDQTGKFVMEIDKNHEVHKVNIKTGGIYGIYIVVKDGLKEGDLVIKEGLQKVRTGMKVNPKVEKGSLELSTKTNTKSKAVNTKQTQPENPSKEQNNSNQNNTAEKKKDSSKEQVKPKKTVNTKDNKLQQEQNQG